MIASVPRALEPGPQHRMLRRLGRGGNVLAYVVAGVTIVASAQAVRVFEARGSASIMGFLTSSATYVRAQTSSFYWLMGTPEARGLRITPECSIAYVVGPMLVICGLLASLRRLPLRRVAAAAAVGGSVILVVNLLRIVMVAVAVTHFPSERAMWWWHVVIGSLVSIIGVGVGLALLVRIAFGGRRREPRAPSADRSVPSSG